MELSIRSSATWQPDYDILSKKAVEEGASLEALAKRAIHYSLPFSSQEVRDRGHTLLYNSDISTKACAHLFSDEPDKSKGITSSLRKRKGRSLRSRYFPMLKRVRHDFFSSVDLQFPTENYLHNCTSNRDDFHKQGIPQKTDFDILQQNFRQVKTDLTATVTTGGETCHPESPNPLVNNQFSEIETVNSTFPVQGSARIDGMPPSESNNFGCNNIISRGVQAGSTSTSKLLVPDNDASISKRVDQKRGDHLINGDFTSDGDFLDPSDSVFGIPNKDRLFMDMDGKKRIDDSFCDSTLAVLPMDIDGNETYKVEEKAILIQYSLTSSLNNEPFEDIECKMYCVLNTEDPEIPECKMYCVLNTEDPEIPECKMYCVFNTEDPEMPCNDDVFLLIHAEAPSTSAMISIAENDKNPETILARNNLQGLNSVTKSEEFLQPSKPSLELPCHDDNIVLIHPETPHASSDMVSVFETDAERNNLQVVNSVTKSKENLQPSKPSLELPCKRVDQKSGDSLINGDFTSDVDLLDPSSSVFGIPNNDTLFMDTDGKNLVDDSCSDNTLSVLPMDVDGNETYKVEEKAILIQCSPTSTLNNKPLEYIECKMCCVLNNEDPGIPCNDDIFLFFHAEPSSTTAATISIAESDKNPETIIARNSLQGLNSVKKREELLQPYMPSLEPPCHDDIIVHMIPCTPCASSDMVSVVDTAIKPVSIIERNNLQVVNSDTKSEENLQPSTPSLEPPCHGDIIVPMHPGTPCASSDMVSVVDADIKPVSIIERKNLQVVNSDTKSEENLQPSKPSLELPCHDDIIVVIHPETPCASSDLVSVVETDINPVSIIERNNLQVVNSVKKSEENFQLSKPSLELTCNDDTFLLIHPEKPCASDTISIVKTDIYPLSIIKQTILQGVNLVTKNEELLQSSKPLPDIPCRDDIFLFTHPETPCASFDILPATKSDINPVSIIERNNPQGLGLVKKSEEFLQPPKPSLEIPCNDDTFLLIRDTLCASSAIKSIATKSDIKHVSIIEENSEQGLNSVKNGEELTQLSQTSQLVLSLKFPEMDQLPAGGGPTIRDISNNICKNLTTNKPAQTSLAFVHATKLDKDFKKVNSEAGETPAILTELPLNIETGPVEMDYAESVVNPSISDHEGPESDIDDPTFSEIEALILGMDLGSFNDGLDFTRRGPVSRYQQENPQRKIRRLERSAQASIQRAMTSGAFAVLYGPRSRHLIRKTEVILGRSTEDTVVDIDLGKEGCHTKISRNQAILKMKDDGSFLLKNLAKNPMLVNGKEVGTGMFVSLSSGCLIEIGGLRLVFESNQILVNRFLKNIEKKKQEQMAKFEWLPMEDESTS